MENEGEGSLYLKEGERSQQRCWQNTLDWRRQSQGRNSGGQMTNSVQKNVHFSHPRSPSSTAEEADLPNAIWHGDVAQIRCVQNAIRVRNLWIMHNPQISFFFYKKSISYHLLMIFMWKTLIAMLLMVYSLWSKANESKGISYYLPIQLMKDLFCQTLTKNFVLCYILHWNLNTPTRKSILKLSCVGFWLLH